MNHQETVTALKTAAKNIGVAAVMSYFVTVAPWARVPVLNSIVRWLVKYVLGIAIDKTEMGAFFLFIDVRTSTQGKDFAQAALRNKEVQVHGTEAEKRKAEQDLIAAFRILVRFSS